MGNTWSMCQRNSKGHKMHHLESPQNRALVCSDKLIPTEPDSFSYTRKAKSLASKESILAKEENLRKQKVIVPVGMSIKNFKAIQLKEAGLDSPYSSDRDIPRVPKHSRHNSQYRVAQFRETLDTYRDD